MWICPNCKREFKRTNQSHYCGEAPVSIDEYIFRQEQDVQSMLIHIRNAIHNAIPDAEETISWGMPTWKKKGNIIHFAVQKNYISVYVGQEAIQFFEERLEGFETNKGAIHLKPDKEPPLSLIADIAGWCYAMEQLMPKME